MLTAIIAPLKKKPPIEERMGKVRFVNVPNNFPTLCVVAAIKLFSCGLLGVALRIKVSIDGLEIALTIPANAQ